MRLLNIILVIFFTITNQIKADQNNQILEILKKGGNLIFIRHAYAPGGGDPNNFNINDCSTQRNLSDIGREQSKKIRNFLNLREYIEVETPILQPIPGGATLIFDVELISTSN